MSGRRNFVLLAVLSSIATALGCDIPNPGIAPVAGTLNFPIALALSAPRATEGSAGYLLVANSNYDARYNQGTLLSLDMDVIEERFDTIAREGRYQHCTNPASWDDLHVECQIGEVTDVMVGSTPTGTGGEVWIDSFASGIVVSPQGDRVYLPTRATANLTWIDLDAEGHLGCEQGTGSFRCAARRRTTIAETGCPMRDVTLTGDPNALVAMSLSDLTGNPDDARRDVLVMVQRNGTAALYLDRLEGSTREPVRTHILTGLPSDAVNASLERATGLTWVNTASPVSTRATRIVGRIGVFIDPQTEACSQAFAAPGIFLDGLATGFDTRDAAFGTSGRYAYVLSRSPESVITIDQQGTPLLQGAAAIVDVDDVGFGPSRMRLGRIGGRDFLFVTTFDGRTIWVLGTEPTEVVSIVPGFDGAYEMVVDEAREMLIVADFKTSVLRFIDLSPLAFGHDAVVLGRVGTPRTHVGFP